VLDDQPASYRRFGERTGKVMRLFVDGVRVKHAGALASTLELPPVVAFDRQLELGSLRGRWRCYGGELDEVAVYAHALSSLRIAAHYRTATTPRG
jgi:hypothetical protein